LICDECRTHFDAVQGHLNDLHIGFTLDVRLVRGLDYYTKTAFEFKAGGLGAQDSIGGGGRYDGLVEQCGGPATPGVGVGMGLERILLVREALGLSATETPRHGILLVALGDEAWRRGVGIVAQLRNSGLEAEIDYRRRSLKAQLRFADNEHFATAVILGEDELARGIAIIRDMESSEQREVDFTALPRVLAE
jgi:histidyl-tRNA synthetase